MNTADHCDVQAARLPTKVALVDGRQALTWRGVSEHSIGLAAALVGLGLPRGAVVYGQLPTCLELILLRLACERAGLRLVTVPPAFRQAEISRVIEVTRPTVAIVPGRYRDTDYAALLASVSAAKVIERVYGLRRWAHAPEATLEDLVESVEVTDASRAVLAERACRESEGSQIAPTSGSTGVPKLVDVGVRGRLLTARVQIERYRVREDDVVLALTPILTGTADALGYHGCPQAGCRLVLTEHFDAVEACRAIVAHRATVVIGVPTMAARILGCTAVDTIPRGLVRIFVSHASVLAPSLAEAIEARLGCRVLQAYGVLEFGGVCATSYDDPAEVRLTTVGRPLDGNEVVVMDPAGRRLGPGQPGRLYVRGEHGDARYYNNPTLTQAAWVNGYYELMDIGQMDPHGNVTLVGRAAEVIIRGGQNIYPRDIEEVLLRHPGVSEAAVIPLPHPDLGEIVCACIVPTSGATTTGEALLAFLREEGIARFKLPERFGFFDSFPILAAGHKVDKHRLKDLVQGQG